MHEMLKASPFWSSVVMVGYVTHAESIAFVMQSEMSLLIVDEAKESAEIVPGKVYEYLGVGRPILALAPRDSAIERLLLETQAGFSVPQSDVAGIADALVTSIERWRQGMQIAEPLADVVRQYERRESARQLAQMLDDLHREAG